MTTSARPYAKFAMLGFLAVYGFVCLRAPEEWRLLDGVNLAIHETGGGEHDWTYLLGDAGMLENDLQISALVRGAGVMVYLVALGLGTIAALQRPPVRELAADAVPLPSGRVP